ncbi:sensor histidine kinase [Glycocaulis abyssi]|uniref:Sensor histidine kinase n=1 Tax=Glycocaulis abyssi TaxID=1433403 RepID=A0ABV9NBE2_9PROT
MTAKEFPPIRRLTGQFTDAALEAAYCDDSWSVQRTQIALTMAGLGLGLISSLSSDFLYLYGSEWFLPTATLRGSAGLTGLLGCAWLLIARPGWKEVMPSLVIRVWIALGLAAAIMVAMAFPAVETTPEGRSSVLVFTAFWISIFAIVIGFGASAYPVAVALFCSGLAICYLALTAWYWDIASYPKITQSVLVLMACAFGWIMAVVSNIRARRRFHIMRLYAAARDAAEKSEEFQTFLLAATGHDIRQPLYALGLNASALEIMAERGDLEQVRVLARRQKIVARNMSALLSSILTLSSFHLGKRESGSQISPVDRLIADAVEPLEELAADKAIQIRHRRSRLEVQADPGIVVHVLSNLLANAISHSQGTKILLGGRRRGQEVDIFVMDDGVGLSSRDVIITSLTDLRSAEEQARLNAGLGIEIMFGLCARGGLRLKLHSRPGFGVKAVLTCAAARASSLSADLEA